MRISTYKIPEKAIFLFSLLLFFFIIHNVIGFLNNRVLEFFNKIGQIGFSPEDSIQLRVNKRILSNITYLVTICGILWSLMYLSLGLIVPAIPPLLYSIIVGVSLYYFGLYRNYDSFVQIQLVMILILPFSLQWSLGGFAQSGVAMVWAILAPFGSLIFQENKKAIQCLLVYLLFLGISVIQDIYFPGDRKAAWMELLFFCMNISAVSIMSFFSMFYFVNISKKEFENEVLLNKQKEIIENQRKLTESYARFVPKEFISFLDKDSIIDTRLGDFMEDEMTVLFSDIRGFTRISETMESRELMRFLNSYLSITSPIIKNHEGFVDKFIGDAIMAIFPQSPLNALNCSVELIKTLQEKNKTELEFSKNNIKIGIGMHTGKMTLGTIGSQERMDTTVIGDAVNLASRIESLTKIFHTPILISEEFYNRLPEQERNCIREIDIVTVKGKTEPIRIYEVFAADSESILSKKLSIHDSLQEAIRLFRLGEASGAKELFIKCQKICPEDSIPVLYLNRCENMRFEKSSHFLYSIDDLSQRKKRVLICEDNEALIDLMQFQIRKKNFDVINCTNGKDAILKYEQFTPDVVLTDLHMPDMDGFQVAEQITKISKERREEPKIIFVTSEDSEETRNQIAMKGHSFLPKPIDFKVLITLLEQVSF